jgi:hypothetical protein
MTQKNVKNSMFGTDSMQQMISVRVCKTRWCPCHIFCIDFPFLETKKLMQSTGG